MPALVALACSVFAFGAHAATRWSARSHSAHPEARLARATGPADVASPAAKLAELGCEGCHLPLDRPLPAMFASRDVFVATRLDDAACAVCHVNNRSGVTQAARVPWLPFSEAAASRIARSHPYLHAPDLAARITEVSAAPSGGERWSLQRFSECGARRFLAGPVPRRLRASESMFPVPRERIESLVATSGLEPCGSGELASGPEVERGRALFFARGCNACHGTRLEAPLLRLGFPLLSRAYFAARVRAGTTGTVAPAWAASWHVEGARLVASRTPSEASVAMPAFADLADADADALYAYVASDRTDIAPAPPAPAPLPRDVWPAAVGLSVFRTLQHDVFDGACRHCHDPRPSSQAALVHTLGRGPTVAFPSSGVRGVASPALRRVLSPGPGCSESELVVRLRQRAREWAGAATEAAAPGMPMTLPPLRPEIVRLVDAWTRQGCPSDDGPLCDVPGACARAGEAMPLP